MLDWNVDPIDVANCLANGETIEEYEDGGLLVLGRAVDGRPLHVAISEPERDTTVVRTLYEPSPLRWDATFRVRMSS